MLGREQIREIVATLSMNKLRTILTGLAVGWGVLILVILLSSGTGISRGIMRNISAQGLNNSAVDISFGYLSEPYNGLPRWYEPAYHIDDCYEIQRQMPQIQLVAPYNNRWGIRVSYADRAGETYLFGVTEAYSQVRHLKYKVSSSRFINTRDEREIRKVIVLNDYLARSLFNTEEAALGKQVMISGSGYTVIGVHEDSYGENGKSYIPLSTMQIMRLSGSDHRTNQVWGMQALCPSIDSDEAEEAFDQALTQICAGMKGFSPSDERAIRVDSQAAMLGTMKQVFFGIDLFLWLIGLSTLIIGVVGVINIMQIAVTERKREIGIRKALGAKTKDIIGMVLTESVFITLISGLMGLVVGVGIMALVDYIMVVNGWGVKEIGSFKSYLFINPNITVSTAIGAILVMMLGGLLAGYLPARKALRIPTVEAMRQ